MGLDDRAELEQDTHLLAGRYRLGSLLGRGAAATVREAVDVVLGRPVAVKLFQAGDNPVGRFRFATEARLLAGLSHPRLVTVHDVCLENDRPFLVMELVNGPTLRDLIDRGPFEPATVARLGAQLADVLAYLHGRDVVHRDIKPSNVLVDAEGDCRLTDFGIARALSAAHLTVSGELVGTAAYLAPEQVTDVDTGPPADVYALGLLLLECLTGRTEYTGTTVEVALARLSRAPRVPDTLPDAWRGVLSAMTATDPACRPDAARCGELLTAIAQGRDSEPPVPVPRTPAEQAPPAAVAPARRPARPRAVHAGLTALALAAAVVGVATATSPTVPGHPAGEPAQTSTPPAAGSDSGADPGTGPGADPGADSAADPATDSVSSPDDAPVTPAGNAQGSPTPPGQTRPTTTQTTSAPATRTTTAPAPPTTTGQGQGKPAEQASKTNGKENGKPNNSRTGGPQSPRGTG